MHTEQQACSGSPKTLDRGQRRVFDCGQGEAVFALRRRGRREEGMHTERQERGMETDAERQREEEEVGRE